MSAYRVSMTAFLLCLLPSNVLAHFIWLVPAGEAGNPVISVRFGEDASDDSPEYLSFVKGMAISMVKGDQKAVPLKVETTDEAVFVRANEVEDTLFLATHDLGVMDRGDKVFRLEYYAKAGPEAGSTVWQQTDCRDDIALDIVPSLAGDKVSLTVCFNEQPVEGAQVIVARPESDDVEATTDANGQVTFATAGSGVYSVRARHVEAKAGEYKGKAYPETRYYCTIALDVSAAVSAVALENLPQPVTSFGAAILQDAMYLYGGHTGSAHSYSKQEQSNELTRLDLKTGKWSTVIDGPHLQGLALVTDGKALYRVGGLTAMNAEGEDHNLQSQNCVARFDPEAGTWTDLPPLPECRSSHDAAVVGNTLYVAGGWQMADGDSQWHSTAWKMDLSRDELKWEPIAAPPFRRRAVALAAHNDKLYVVGGMTEDDGPTTAVSIYAPAADTWADGPSLLVQSDKEAKDDDKPGRGGMSSGAMAGFGASAFATGGSLYVTTVQGLLQQLSEDGKSWDIVSSEVTPRFFHRLLPLDEEHLITVGGANMSIGKFDEVEVIAVRPGT